MQALSQMRLHRRSFLALLASAGLPGFARAAEGEMTDHPLLSGMSGFGLRSKTVRDADTFALEQVCGKLPSQALPWLVDGKVTRMEYRPQGKGSGPLAILRSYQQAIAKAGASSSTPASASTTTACSTSRTSSVCRSTRPRWWWSSTSTRATIS